MNKNTLRRTLVATAVGAAAAFTGIAWSTDAHADADPSIGCETIRWGFLGSQRRTICDGPRRADGSWTRARSSGPGGIRPPVHLLRHLLVLIVGRLLPRGDAAGEGDLRGVRLQRAARRAGLVATGDGCDPVTNGIPCEECQEHPAVLEIEGRYLCLVCITPPQVENSL